MTNDFNSTINALCEKFGTTVSELLPEIAKMKTVGALCWLIIAAISILIGIRLLLFFLKKYKDADIFAGEIYVLASTVTAVFLIFFVLLFIFNIHSLVVWLSAPNAKAVDHILSLLGGK